MPIGGIVVSFHTWYAEDKFSFSEVGDVAYEPLVMMSDSKLDLSSASDSVLTDLTICEADPTGIGQGDDRE